MSTVLGEPAGAGGATDGGHTPPVLSTLNNDGSRRWLCPRPSAGRFLSARRAVAVALIAIFTLIPYVEINHKPAVLLDLAARRFHILGVTFLPTDTLLLALGMVAVFVSIFLLTALFGRVWCGWACPQTVYLEFVYRPLERFFTGEPGRPKATRGVGGWLHAGAGKPLMYVAYFVASCFLAHTFLAYFVGVERLATWVTRSPLEHPGGFLVMAAVTGLMLFDFAFFREQTCIVACPYGRLQSVMLDKHSLIVSYDRARGEPRGRKGKGEATLALPVLPVAGVGGGRTGDCVDCAMCVTTCPTGIDIRNGLQMECVGCAQCIDACDSVMTKLKRPTGLIRYTSQAAMEGGVFRFLRPRVVIYPLILAVVLSAMVVLLATRTPAYVLVQRGLGAPFSVLPSGEVSNPLTVRLVNKRDVPSTFTVETLDPRARVIAERSPIVAQAAEAVSVPVTLIVPADVFAGGAHIARLRISDGHGYSKEVTFRMMGPAKRPSGQGGGS